MTNYYSYIKTDDTYLDNTSHATYKGIAIKTSILLGYTIIIGILSAIFLKNLPGSSLEVYLSGLGVAVIIGAISAIIGRISYRAAKVCSFIYSTAYGAFLGVITAIIDMYYPHAGTLAMTATVIIFAVMLLLYAFGFIRNSSIIRTIFFGLVFGILALVIFDFIYVLLTGSANVTLYFLIQGLLLVYGVISLTFNFAEAEAVTKMGAPKSAEWSVALGMLVSLIYIYIQVLKIILIFMDRR